VKYRLVSLGRLKKGVSEQEALQALMKITKLPELTVRQKLLAGKRTNLLTSPDVTKVAATKGKFSALGLMVEVIEVPDPAEQAPPEKPKRSFGLGGFGSFLKRASVTVLAIALLLAGVVGGLWYWLFMAVNDNASVESALVTPNTSAIVNVDMAQLAKLETLSRIQLADILADAESPSLIADMITLTAREDFNADQVFLSVIGQDAEDASDVLTVVTGEFTVDAWRGVLSRFYELNNAPQSMLELRPKTVVAQDQCPAEVDESAQPLFAKVSGNRVVLSTNADAIQRFEARVSAGSTVSDNLTQWQAYRKYKLVSAMVFSPKNSTSVMSGMAGMIGNQLLKTIPNVTGAALSTQVDIMSQGVRLNAALISSDSTWNQTWAGNANDWLNTTKNDSKITSEALADILSGLNFSASDQSLDVDWPINYRMFSDLQHSLQNSLASAFGGSMSSGGAVETEIDESPIIYNLPLNLAKLPAFEVPSYGTKPLFTNGAFAADINNLRMNDEGFLELAVESKAALPKFENSETLGELMRYSLVVNQVSNGQGESLIRDELCVTSTSSFNSKNHEPETNGTAFFEQASSTKRVRLNEGTNVSDIQFVAGDFTLSYPRNVQKFSVPLAAGETVNHAGLTFEVISLTDHSVRYKLSGNKEHLMEVRALNDQGSVLRQSWSSGFGKMKDQNFQGTVVALEIYIADGFNSTNMPFSLENIFVREGEEDDAVHPFALSYTTVQRAKWNNYQFVDMRLVRPKPEDWTYGEDPRRAVATKAWPGFKLFVTHKPSGWNANPDAHLNLPLWIELYASMSSLSYNLDSDSVKKTRYVPVRFPYSTGTGLQLVESHSVRQQPFGLVNFKFDADYKEDQPFGDLKGYLTVRMPQKLAQKDVPFTELWREKDVNGMFVKLDNVSRGGLAGYHFEIRGDLDNLIAVHGVDNYGQRIAPSSLNYQDGGYWTVTVPFREDLNALRVVTATEQDIFELPFDF
jgi:hypothetical protein